MAVKVSISLDPDPSPDNRHAPLPDPALVAGHFIEALRSQARDLEPDLGLRRDWIDACMIELNDYPEGRAWSLARSLNPGPVPARASLLTDEIADQINAAHAARLAADPLQPPRPDAPWEAGQAAGSADGEQIKQWRGEIEAARLVARIGTDADGWWTITAHEPDFDPADPRRHGYRVIDDAVVPVDPSDLDLTL